MIIGMEKTKQTIRQQKAKYLVEVWWWIFSSAEVRQAPDGISDH